MSHQCTDCKVSRQPSHFTQGPKCNCVMFCSSRQSFKLSRLHRCQRRHCRHCSQKCLNTAHYFGLCPTIVCFKIFSMGNALLLRQILHFALKHCCLLKHDSASIGRKHHHPLWVNVILRFIAWLLSQLRPCLKHPVLRLVESNLVNYFSFWTKQNQYIFTPKYLHFRALNRDLRNSPRSWQCTN